MIEFRLPSLGADMDEGKLLEWRVQPGDAVKKGQVVCVVDTAKAAIDVECWHDGTVQRLLIEPGRTIPVGTPMAVLREAGESGTEVERRLAPPAPAAPPPAARPPPAEARPAAPAAAAAAPSAATAPQRAAAPAERRRISPAARRRAGELGIDIDDVAAGADGTVALADVEQAARRAQPPPAAEAPAREAPAPEAAAARAPAPSAATMAETTATPSAPLRMISAALPRCKPPMPTSGRLTACRMTLSPSTPNAGAVSVLVGVW
jgi:pyruvate dehydrogenase E2 component (dihydrolipoamide acetyltransferase)